MRGLTPTRRQRRCGISRLSLVNLMAAFQASPLFKGPILADKRSTIARRERPELPRDRSSNELRERHFQDRSRTPAESILIGKRGGPIPSHFPVPVCAPRAAPGVGVMVHDGKPERGEVRGRKRRPCPPSPGRGPSHSGTAPVTTSAAPRGQNFTPSDPAGNLKTWKTGKLET
jgi:hypothetical protein